MDGQPLFSVIIPVYKIEKYISECVNSVLKQNFTDFEILLVDDGSPDACPQICDAFSKADPRVKVIHKINEGVSLARKTALDVASGTYAVCIDGDDWIAPECLNSLADIIYQFGVDIICYGSFIGRGKNDYRLSESLNRFGLYDRSSIKKEIFPSLIHNANGKYFAPSVCGKAIKTELLKKYILADPLAIIGEDGACAIPCVFHAESIYITEQHFYYYRYNESSATKSKKAFNWEWPEIVSKHLEKNIDVDCQDIRAQLNRKFTHDVFSVALSQFNRDDKYGAIVTDIKIHIANQYYKDAIKNSKFKLFGKEWAARIALRYHLFLVVKIYSLLLNLDKR